MTHGQNPHSSQQENELETVRNEVLRKIGRNVVLFQQIEQHIKFILIAGNYSAYISEFQAQLEQKSAIQAKRTMGQLIEPFIENIYGPVIEKQEIEDLKEIRISFSVKLESSSEECEQRKETWKMIVAERNQLIHHLLPKWDMSSIDSSKEIERYLDEQKKKILPELEILRCIVEGIKEHCNFMNSEEGKKQLGLAILRQSPLVGLLFNIAKQHARSDGWMVLSKAAQFIHEQAPRELIDLPKRYDYKNIKSILLATEFFDISEEPTDKGGIRVIYRIKPNLVFEE